jgi:hypothetical protein
MKAVLDTHPGIPKAPRGVDKRCRTGQVWPASSVELSLLRMPRLLLVERGHNVAVIHVRHATATASVSPVR